MIAAKFAYLVFGQSIISILGYVALFILARNFGSEGLGQLAIALSFLGIFQYITHAGFNTTHLKRMSEGDNDARNIGVYGMSKLILTAIYVLVVLGTYHLTEFMVGEHKSNEFDDLIYIMLLVFALRSFVEIPTQTFIARKDVARQISPGILAAIVRLAGIVVSVTFFNSIFAVAICYLVAEVFAALLAFTLFRNESIEKPQAKDWKSYFTFAWPMFFIGVVNSIELHLDKILIGMYVSISAVGIYYTAQRLASLFEIITSKLVFIYFPTISKLFHEGKVDKVSRLAARMEIFLSIFTIPLLLYVWIYADNIMALFNEEFAFGGDIFRYLLAAISVTIISIPSSEQISAADYPKLKMLISVVVRLITVMLVIISVPDSIGGIELLGLGIVGAAIAKFISRVIFFTVCKLVCIRKFNGEPGWRFMALCFLCLIGVLVIEQYGTYLSDGLSLINLIVMFPVMYLVTLPIFYILGLFKIDEIKYLIQLLRTMTTQFKRSQTS